MTSHSVYFLVIFIQIYFIYNFYQQKRINLIIKNKKLAELKNLTLKYENIYKEYSDLTKTHIDMIEKHNLDISNLKNQINQKLTSINDLKHNIKTIEKNNKNILAQKIKEARQDTIKRSRSVLRGQASEHLAPFVIKDTNPKDYRFIGNPIDYICFDGLSDIIDKTSNEIISVKFIDIKTGKSSLTKTQRKIRDAIKENKVTFEVINLDKELSDD
jgi:predicted Holliday junction resolvase-like endonuclease